MNEEYATFTYSRIKERKKEGWGRAKDWSPTPPKPPDKPFLLWRGRVSEEKRGGGPLSLSFQESRVGIPPHPYRNRGKNKYRTIGWDKVDEWVMGG